MADLSQPRFWAGLRLGTPSNLPCIGRTRVDRLWVNAGHGALGWTHGAGSGRALGELMSGKRPALDFGFLGAPIANGPPCRRAGPRPGRSPSARGR